MGTSNRFMKFFDNSTVLFVKRDFYKKCHLLCMWKYNMVPAYDSFCNFVKRRFHIYAHL